MQDPDLQGPRSATTPYLEDCTPYSGDHAACWGCQDAGAISALFCQLRPTRLYLNIRMAPDHLLLGRGSGVATSPSERDAHHSQPGARTSPFEGFGTSTCLPDLLVCTTALRPGGPGPPLEYARS